MLFKFTHSHSCCCIALLVAALSSHASATACGSVDPNKVDRIPSANQRSATPRSFIVDWTASNSDPGSPFSYRLRCSGAGCPTEEFSTTNRSYEFVSLNAATVYNVSIIAAASGCNSSDPFVVTCRTELTALEGNLSFSSVTETRFHAFWTASPDAGVTYVASCGIRTGVPTVVCVDQPSGSDITVFVHAEKDGFPATRSISGKVRTKLSAVETSTVRITKNDTAITVSWAPSGTLGVYYELACRGSTESKIIPTEYPQATCSYLLCEQNYNVTLTVKKDGFNDLVTSMGQQRPSPYLSRNPADFNVSWGYTGDSEPWLQLTLTWTLGAARCTSHMYATVTSELDPENRVELQEYLHYLITHTYYYRWYYSNNLKVSFAAEQNSPDGFVIYVLTPPNRPSVSLDPNKRSIKVTLKATSKADYLYAMLDKIAVTCIPSPDNSCSVTLQPLKPFTEYQIKAYALYQNLSSLLTDGATRTLEDAPTPPVSVTAQDMAFRKIKVRWLQPTDPNGIIASYGVFWGSLSLPDGAELPGRNDTTSGSSIELSQPLSLGQEFYFYVTACTRAGCSDRSERAILLVDDAEANAVTLSTVTVSNTSVTVSWLPLSFSQGVVFEYVVLFVEQSRNECATALLVSCSNCRRSRDQISTEGRSQLESLTRDCSGAGADSRFDYRDSQVSASASIQSASDSTRHLVPWTKYTVKVLPVNRAGPGVSSSAREFRTPEAPSGRVKYLTVSVESSDTARIEFGEPEMKNGLLLAYAIQLFGINNTQSTCSLTVLTIESELCQLASCNTDQIIKTLIKECGNRVTQYSVQSGPDKLMSVRMDQLQTRVNYSVRVTPLSQTLAGQTAYRSFRIDGGSGPTTRPVPPVSVPNTGTIVTVVSVVVPVVVLAIALVAVTYLILRYRNATTSIPSGNANRARSAREDQFDVNPVIDALELVMDEHLPNRDPIN